jgi:uncharacterized protein (TIGR01777 family)
MRIAVSGGTGFIGRRVVAALRERGDEVTVLSRSAGDVRWDPRAAPAPASGLAGCEAVIHLAGENVAQRWTNGAKRAIRDSRVIGTENLIAGLRSATPRPSTLLCASAVGYYGDRGDERLDEAAGPGQDWLAALCVDWERAAAGAREHGMRVVSVRTGIVLHRSGGALAQMLPPFRVGLGGPVAGGRQYMPWIEIDDIVGIYLAALDDDRYSGAINATAPQPATNREFSKALGSVLHRPAIVPVPRLALRLAFGEMGEVVTGSQNAVPARPLELGYRFHHPELEGALRAALA